MSHLFDVSSQCRQMFAGLASGNSSLYLVDLATGEFEVIKTDMEDELSSIRKANPGVSDFRLLCVNFVEEQHVGRFMEYCDLASVADKLSTADELPVISISSRFNQTCFRNLQWKVALRDMNGRAVAAFFAVSNIDAVTFRQTARLREINDTLDIASLGLWSISLFDGEKPRMTATNVMLKHIGLNPNVTYSREYVYETWYAGIHSDDVASVLKSVEKMKLGQKDENTYRWMHPLMGVRYVRCGGVAYKVPGRGYKLYGYHYDVTDFVHASEEKKLVVNALAKTYTCLYYVDLQKDSYTSYFNGHPIIQSLIPSTGKFSSSVEVFLNSIVKPEFEPKLREFMDFSTLEQRLAHAGSISAQFKGLMEYWCEASIMVCDRNLDGSICHMIMGIRNIDEQKRNELRLIDQIRANKEEISAKSVLLQNMSHEIRTPLNAMFGYSQLLGMSEGIVTETERNEYINYIHNSFNMLSMLIDDVLDVADDEHGNFRIVNGDVNVNEICRSVLQMAEMRRPSAVRMYFTTEVADGFVINSDGRRIQQVLINYLTNACKHTTQGEIHLHLSSTENQGHLTFSVADTGPGVPPEMAKDIFERFKKLNNMVQGSGLGLNICSVIADKMGAEVRLDTTYTNGARFLFII